MERGERCRFRTFSDQGGGVYVHGVSEPTASEAIHVIVVMGVSGAGKTLVGRTLADALGWPFHEGDDYHSAANIEKMSHGIPLTDDDRAPWLAALHHLIVGIITRDERGVVACSALKHSYRQDLASTTLRRSAVRFVYLDVPRAVLEQRLRARRGHFAPPELLDSQLATLEEPHDALRVNGDQPPAEIVREIRTRLGV
jgi:gluconokinase